MKAPQHRGTPRSYPRQRVRLLRLVLLVDLDLGDVDPAQMEAEDLMDMVLNDKEAKFDSCDLGVPRCCGAFTPSTRVVSRRGGRGWFLS